ncbi:unnamed protein product [Linum trigynum]|uniref:Uncharacterized protein n=1 Tax=Linum trigynum TaxID=586398 RepID=A0AAV2GH03_9ROSI
MVDFIYLGSHRCEFRRIERGDAWAAVLDLLKKKEKETDVGRRDSLKEPDPIAMIVNSSSSTLDSFSCSPFAVQDSFVQLIFLLVRYRLKSQIPKR